jgi:hypothetical protein
MVNPNPRRKHHLAEMETIAKTDFEDENLTI